nr:acyl-CoA dehydrogenase family protein [Candidatus Microthrix sp.]
MSFTETPEQLALREAVAQLGAAYGYEYMVGKARSGGDMAELYAEAGKLGYLGVNLPTEYGGGGGGMYELAIVEEELGTAGCGLLMMVVSPAICGTVIAKYGTDSQKDRWLPGLADGSEIMAFAITESDAGSNSHRITTTARRDGDDWVLSGAKTYISGVDVAQNVLVVARTEDSATGALKPVLFVVPTDSTGLEYTKIEMDMISADHQFTVFIDDVRLPSDALVGSEDAAIDQLFAGLNPERIMASSFAIGMARYALNIAVNYARNASCGGTNRSGRIRVLRTRSPRPTSRSNWQSS